MIYHWHHYPQQSLDPLKVDILVESMAILPLFVSDVTKVEHAILEHEGTDCALELGLAPPNDSLTVVATAILDLLE